MRLTSTQPTALWKHVASFSFLFALCFSLAAQNGCEDDAGNIYGPYEELVVSDDPCENFTCIPSAFSFVWVSNSEYLDDCGGDEENDEVEGEDWADLIDWLEEICASNDTLEVDVDVELACEALALIEACDNGSEEACAELEALWDEFGNLWDDEEEEEEEEDDEEDDEEEDDEEDEEGEDDGDDDLDEEDWLDLMDWLEEICSSNDTLEGDIEVEMACAALELIEACADGEEAACEELEMLLEDLWDDEEGGDDDEENDDEEGEDDDEENDDEEGEDDDEEDDDEEGENDDEENDDDEEGEDDGEFDEEDLEALIEWLEEICGSNVPNDLGIDPDMACGILELIEACADGNEEACEELEMLLEELEDLWDEEDEDDDEEEEDDEDECEVEFEFEQALDEDGVPLPYNIVAYVDEPEADTYYFWSFGDGNESDEPNPTHIYEEVGNYEVCLTVTQMVGNFLECTATHCDTLMIDMDGLVRQQLVLNILFPGQTINAVVEQDLTLDVHPNPAADAFRIRAEAGIESAVVRTMDGRWVGRWVSNGLQTIEVPCHAWSTGAYVLEVRTAEGVMRSRVLVRH